MSAHTLAVVIVGVLCAAAFMVSAIIFVTALEIIKSAKNHLEKEKIHELETRL